MEKNQFIYKDRFGTIVGTMTNDGKEIRVNLNEWEFVGEMLDDMEPVRKKGLPSRFRLEHGGLCDCTFEFGIPILIRSQNELINSELLFTCELGKPKERGGIDREMFQISLDYKAKKTVSPGASGWVEDELLEIQKQLPENVFIQACINCQYSDYSPIGNGAFGKMMCFKNMKQEYLQVKSKDEFWGVHDLFDQFVQETWLCDEFERRTPGTGYRG